MPNRKLFETLLEQQSESLVRYNEPMAQHTTFRIGGMADYYAEPSSRESLVSMLSAAKSCAVPYLVIGRGSNLLFDDNGFRGLIISTVAMKAVSVLGNTITADAGVQLTALSKAALDASLCGLQFANGIPGSVGGAVFMNAGAYDGEISKVLTESVYYDTDTGAFETIDNEMHNFGYRKSVYRECLNRVIISASFCLSCGDQAEIRRKMDDFMSRRSEKQPLEYPSAGSVFKRYPGRFTAQLIDEAGLKGCTIGGAQVSEKHAGFIINRGGATAKDVLTLIEKIQAEIRRIHGIEIETEVVYVRG